MTGLDDQAAKSESAGINVSVILCKRFREKEESIADYLGRNLRRVKASVPLLSSTCLNKSGRSAAE